MSQRIPRDSKKSPEGFHEFGTPEYYLHYAKEWLSWPNDKKRSVLLERDGILLMQDNQFRNELYRYMKEQDKPKHYYLITFTLKAGADEEKAESCIRRIPLRTSLQCDEFHLVKEYTQAGVAHWHAAGVFFKPLKKDRLNYYSKTFGHVDISKNKAQMIDEMLEYMSKAGIPERLK